MRKGTVPMIPTQAIKDIGVRIVGFVVGAEGRSQLPQPHGDATPLDVAGYALIDILMELTEKPGTTLRSKMIQCAQTLAFPYVESPSDKRWEWDVAEEDIEMYRLMMTPSVKSILGDAPLGISYDDALCGVVYGAIGCLVGSHSLNQAREQVIGRLNQSSLALLETTPA